VIGSLVRLQAEFVFVGNPAVADVFQEKVWVPVQGMPVILTGTFSVVERPADPGRNLLLFLETSLRLTAEFVRICGTFCGVSPFASDLSSPFHTKVLMGQKGFLFLPIPCV